MNNEFIGRRVSVGFGIEGTPGTEVAPAIWMRHLSLDFARKTNVIQNNSAMGRVESVNDSAVVGQWAEGKLEGKLYDLSSGYLLYNIFGIKNTTTNADASGIVKNHTFDVGQASVAPTLTITRTDPLTNRRHGLGTLSNLEITGESGAWVKVSGDMQAKAGVAGTDVTSYTVENPFVAKHITAKIAANVAGLGAATSLAGKSFKLTITRTVTPFFPFGSNDPTAFNVESWEASGEIVLRYTATDLEDLSFANTPRALLLGITNTDVTIGTAARPGLVFTAPQVRLSTFAMSNDLDKIVEQTVGFTCELSTTAGYALRAVLTNTQVAY